MLYRKHLRRMLWTSTNSFITSSTFAVTVVWKKNWFFLDSRLMCNNTIFIYRNWTPIKREGWGREMHIPRLQFHRDNTYKYKLLYYTLPAECMVNTQNYYSLRQKIFANFIIFMRMMTFYLPISFLIMILRKRDQHRSKALEESFPSVPIPFAEEH